MITLSLAGLTTSKKGVHHAGAGRSTLFPIYTHAVYGAKGKQAQKVPQVLESLHYVQPTLS